MSAWLVFAMLGLYPVQPFSGEYVLGAPMLAQAELHLGEGRWLRIGGRGARALLDGRPVDGPAVRHQDLIGAQHLQWR